MWISSLVPATPNPEPPPNTASVIPKATRSHLGILRWDISALPSAGKVFSKAHRAPCTPACQRLACLFHPLLCPGPLHRPCLLAGGSSVSAPRFSSSTTLPSLGHTVLFPSTQLRPASPTIPATAGNPYGHTPVRSPHIRSKHSHFARECLTPCLVPQCSLNKSAHNSPKIAGYSEDLNRVSLPDGSWSLGGKSCVCMCHCVCMYV